MRTFKRKRYRLQSTNTWFDLISVVFAGYTVFFYSGAGIYIQELNLTISYPKRQLLVFVFLCWWILFCPLKKYCNGWWFTALAYNVLPCVAACAEVFFQYHFRLSCVGAVILFIAQGTIMGRTCKKLNAKVCCGFYSRIFVLLSLMMLIVPALYSVRVYHSESPLEAMSRRSMQKHSGLIEKDIQDPGMNFYRQLRAQNWEKANLEQRVEWMQTIVDYEASLLGMQEAPTLCVEALPEFILGSYNAGSEIMINASYLMESNTTAAFDTVFHELYHYYQKAVVGAIDWTSDSAQLSYFDNARRWYQNDSDYKDDCTTEEGMQEYLSQPLESDANEYAKRKVVEYTLKLELAERLD